MFEITRYTASQASEWNAFVSRSKQGTFLFDRNYMDYHADRFEDFSLILRKKGRIYALLPANRVGKQLLSHQGLTYGGLLTNHRATTADVCQAFASINACLAAEGIESVCYKAIPHIYHRTPAEEDLYALTHICKAKIVARHISSAIDLSAPLKFTESRKSGIRKAAKNAITVGESQDMPAFWNILNDNLQHKYSATPVHTLAELRLLKERFPEAIKLYMACNHIGTPIGGTLIYETPQTIHTQYISASPEGKANGALDALFHYIINKVYKGRGGYFDFGKSSDGQGLELNEQLIFQKEGFGARGICYDTYEWNTSKSKEE